MKAAHLQSGRVMLDSSTALALKSASRGPSQAPVQGGTAQVLLRTSLEMNMGKPEMPIKPKSLALDPDELDGLVLLGAKQLRELLTPQVCLAALEDAYRRLHAAQHDNSQSLGFQARGGKFHVKAGLYPQTHEFFAAKVNANFPDNRDRHALATIQGLIVLCDGANGKPLAILHSGELTARRTAAATALAARYGARPNSRTLAIIGCGFQAWYQVKAILGVLPITKVLACDLSRDRAMSLVARIEQKPGLQATHAESVNDAVSASDVIVTCTTGTKVVVMDGMVRPGSFIAAVGADNPDKQELDPKLFERARILVDDLDQCSKSGDLLHAIRAGTATLDSVAATLSDLASGTKPGRGSEDDIVIFDSTGTGLQDVAAAATAYAAVKKDGP